MKITILNGNPDSKNKDFDQYLLDLKRSLEICNHRVRLFRLRDMNIKYCIGCFNCWLKTPGECFAKDESHDICREYINSDLAIFTSPVIMGFVSALLKKINDKLIPLIHPYLEMVNGECHHLARYDRYPALGLILAKDDRTDDEDIEIIREIYRRDAINLKTSLSFAKLTDNPIEEVCNEINNI